MSFTHCEADFQDSFFIGMAATIMLVNTPSKMPIPRLFWINSTTQNIIGGEKTKIQIKLERKGFTKVKRTKYFLKGRICSHVKTKNFQVCIYGIIWWLLHQQDPKGGVYVPCHIVSQSIFPSRLSPYILIARHNLLTNTEIHHHSSFQTLASVIVICEDEPEDFLMLVASFSCLNGMGMLSS